MDDNRLNVLIVEDNPGDLRLIREFLKESSSPVFRTAHAGRLSEALPAMAAGSFDVVLLDLDLPDSSGLAGLEKMTAAAPGIPVIVLTGRNDEALGLEALQKSAGDYLVKGQIDTHLLVRGIKYAIERKRAEEVLRRDKETFEKQVMERSLELLDAQQELEKAKRLSDIGTLAAIVAHELRNPLAAISLAVSNIRRKAANPLLEKNLQNINKKITESNQIISNLLFYSRIRMPKFETADLKAILEECVDAAKSSASRPARIEADITICGPLQADPLQLKEIFSNILDNACDAVSPDPRGKIHVRASGTASSVDIRIEDTGPGIDKDTLGKIFEPFFTTKAKGTGLGLYVCQQIVNLHGGAITVESAAGKGTIVGVTLPRNMKHGEEKNTDN